MLINILAIIFIALNLASFALFISTLRDKVKIIKQKRKLRQMTKTLANGIADVAAIKKEAVNKAVDEITREMKAALTPVI